MSDSLHVVDVTARPVGSHFGGKWASSVECPICKAPALIAKKGRAKGVSWIDYAHRLAFDLDHKHEPRCTPGAVCRSSGDPSKKPRKAKK